MLKCHASRPARNRKQAQRSQDATSSQVGAVAVDQTSVTPLEPSNDGGRELSEDGHSFAYTDHMAPPPYSPRWEAEWPMLVVSVEDV